MFYNMNAADAGKIGRIITAHKAPARDILGSR